MMTVKIGTSRQIIIPKKAYAQLGLAAGDYLEVVVHGDTLVMIPKTLVDKDARHEESEGHEKSETHESEN